jgi:hypothetical protein
MTSATQDISLADANMSLADTRLRRERRFFTGMALLMALICFAGFAPSYYLRAPFGMPPLKPLLHFHGLVFTLWMFLLAGQSSLIAAGRVRLHRRLGIAGGVLAVLLVATGASAIYSRGITVAPNLPHEMVLRFLATAVVLLVMFASLIAVALYFRRNAGAHKRLMLLATTVMLTAAVHRLLMLLIDPTVSPLVFYGATDLLILTIVAYDLISLGRVHVATLWGGMAIIVSQVVSLLLAGSAMWLTFARWITGT